MIADRRSQTIAIDRRRSQKIEHGSIFCDRLRSRSQDRRRSQTSLRSAIIWKPAFMMLFPIVFSNSLIIQKTKEIMHRDVFGNLMKKLLVFASLISPSKSVCLRSHQTLVTVFHHNIKNLEVRQKYSATRRIFNSLLGV